MSEALLTQEVGSLAKPDWRVQPIAGQELTTEHIQQATDWAVRLGLDPTETEDVLCQVRQHQRESGNRQLADDDTSQIKLLAARFAVRLQEQAGLDIIYDGEQDRSEMYQHAVQRTAGFEPRGRVRVFDNRSYKKYAAVDQPGIVQPWHTDEVTRLQGLTNRHLKVPVTGAYTLANWSFDEHFGSARQFVLAIARNVIRPNIQALLSQGAEWVQIDEPAAGTVPSEMELFVDSFNESTEGLEGKFSIHLCYSDWSKLAPYFAKLRNCAQLSIEFANRDSRELGVDVARRPAYEVLADIHRHNPDIGIGLGVVSIHEDYIEPPELVRDRILRAVDLLGDPSKVYPSPDCGLRTRSWEVAYNKLQSTVRGTELAKKALKI